MEGVGYSQSARKTERINIIFICYNWLVLSFEQFSSFPPLKVSPKNQYCGNRVLVIEIYSDTFENVIETCFTIDSSIKMWWLHSDGDGDQRWIFRTSKRQLQRLKVTLAYSVYANFFDRNWSKTMRKPIRLVLLRDILKISMSSSCLFFLNNSIQFCSFFKNCWI